MPCASSESSLQPFPAQLPRRADGIGGESSVSGVLGGVWFYDIGVSVVYIEHVISKHNLLTTLNPKR